MVPAAADVSFIAVGILVGPAGMALVTQHEEVELLASIVISLLLFVVGLKLDFQTILTLGPVALATGVGQIVFTSVIGFLIAVALGMNVLTASYVAVALTFSSTIIVVKLLSDKHEIDALHGVASDAGIPDGNTDTLRWRGAGCKLGPWVALPCQVHLRSMLSICRLPPSCAAGASWPSACRSR